MKVIFNALYYCLLHYSPITNEHHNLSLNMHKKKITP